ncbi:MAG: IS110 family transposase [Limisphaerales bacterium]
MNSTSSKDDTQEDYAAFIAIDWADHEHVWSLQVAGQTNNETGTLEQKPEAIGAWVAKLRKRFGGRSIALALEQSRGALIHALMSYDFLVLYPLPSTMVAKFREAFKPSGAKNDPLDAGEALEILTKHRDQLRPLRPDTEETRLLSRLVEDRRKVVDQRTGHVQALGASLKEYYPQAIEALSGNLASRMAADFLAKWPTFEDFQQAKPQTIRKFYYGHNIRSSQVIQKVMDLAARGKPLTTDAAILESGRRLSQVHAQILQTLDPLIADYDQRIKTLFTQHDEAQLFTNLPGAGPALAPRLLAFFGTDRSRYEAAESVQSFTGIAPVTKSSGRSRVVYFRVPCPKFDRQTFHEFARLSVTNCQWAKNYVNYYRAKGKEYHAVIRALAYKWIRILFRCWKDRTPYDEAKYMKILEERGSIFATLHLAKKS